MQFKVHGGNFGSGAGSLHGTRLTVPKAGWGSETLDASSIASVEMASEERLKKLSGTLGWGAVGALALGPLGMFAGLLVGGRKTETTFVVELKNGRAFVATGDPKVFVALKTAAVAGASVQRRSAPPTLSSGPREPAEAAAPKPASNDLGEVCATWGWALRPQPKTGFERFEIFLCESGSRRIGIAVSPDNVTDYSFAQLSTALEKAGPFEARYIVAPAVGASIQATINKAGVVVTDGADFNSIVASW